MKVFVVILATLLCQLSLAQTRLDYFMAEAAKSRMQGQWSKAMELYSHCLQIDSCSAEALYQLGRISFYLRQDSAGLEYLHKAVDLDPDNTYYIEPLAAILLRQGCEDDALPLLEHISKLQSNRSDVLSHLASIYSKTGRLEDAISTLDRLEMLEGKMSQLSNEKFSLYMEMGDSVKAFAELQSLCDEYPADLSYKIDMAYCYQQLGDYEKALQMYDEVRAIDPANVPLQMAMLDYYLSQGMDSLYDATRDSILYAPETETAKRVVLIQQMVQRMSPDSADTEQIIKRFERVLQLDSTNVELLTMYAAFLDYRQKPQEMIQSVMSRVLLVEPDNEMATQWLLQYYASRKDYFSLEEICRRGVNYHPKDLVYPYFLGMIMLERNNNAEALEVLDRGIRLRSEDTRLALVSDAFTVKGDVFYKMGKHADAFLQYDSALVYNKDNVLCLNNYAYYLSLRNEYLDKAEEMSYRTIKAEPDNRTYLDTYAWILFMQAKYEQAQEYMDKVVPRDSSEQFLMTDLYTSTAILEHAGDIAWMNGDAERATYLWQLAVRRGDDEVTPILRKKAKKRKYYNKK
ncbi:MAG: tetratricopeptide repeat protein [Bacteroidaceae bacterium]|jgi:tetratricopeptide (TPR) repeat protein|nr:tetratricopeptide repeat protein [Bacteroidaceae bacterium]MEE0984110.1 tetratricopeptide repeat protein [Bacteroidaceae bacterium]